MIKNGSKWDVGNSDLPVSSWQWAYDNLTTEMHRDVHRFGAMAPDESRAVIDFIIELVGEIRRLEGDKIKLRDYIDAVNLRTAFRRTRMAVDLHTSPVQPFFMEVED